MFLTDFMEGTSITLSPFFDRTKSEAKFHYDVDLNFHKKVHEKNAFLHFYFSSMVKKLFIFDVIKTYSIRF